MKDRERVCRREQDRKHDSKIMREREKKRERERESVCVRDEGRKDSGKM